MSNQEPKCPLCSGPTLLVDKAKLDEMDTIRVGTGVSVARAGVSCTTLVGAGLSNRIRGYLIGGGLWNPEMADHDNVRDLLIECKTYIDGTLTVERNAPTTHITQPHEKH